MNEVSSACGRFILSVSRDGMTPLHVAARNGGAECAKLLLDAGASVDVDIPSGVRPDEVSSSRSWRPLILAVRYGHVETVKLLIDRGADVNQESTPETIVL